MLKKYLYVSLLSALSFTSLAHGMEDKSSPERSITIWPKKKISYSTPRDFEGNETFSIDTNENLENLGMQLTGIGTKYRFR